ncbi:BSD domain-containing protein [Abeliophyllum distichum]|uniref:BSD domain-containing protein n=1 Tax=Abeliophyllum distichum TaxID=126358 RepID=A0ABD1P8Y3_9LAMI
MRRRKRENWGEYGEGEPGHFGKYSNLSQSEDYYTLENAVGITEEVLAFARNIAHHPETWLDFPLSEEEEFLPPGFASEKGGDFSPPRSPATATGEGRNPLPFAPISGWVGVGGWVG